MRTLTFLGPQASGWDASLAWSLHLVIAMMPTHLSFCIIRPFQLDKRVSAEDMRGSKPVVPEPCSGQGKSGSLPFQGYYSFIATGTVASYCTQAGLF